MRKQQKGFSLIELLIVVAIILIIAAIAIPNLLRSKIAANEASAVGTLRTINTAAVSFSTTYGNYPPLLTDLGPSTSPTSTAADLVDQPVASGSKSGYNFTYGASSTYQQYSITANPITVGVTGQRYFFTDQTGVIRYNLTTTASSSDNPLS
jgi:prepilin-type N-terminal cleavage/methylation domain-containing protein